MESTTVELGKELKKIREESGITLKELCEEIGFEIAPYNLIENGKRTIKDKEVADYLYYKVQKAVHKLTTDAERNYFIVSEDKHKQAIECLNKGYNLVKIAINLEVDEDALRRHFKKNNLEFSEYSDNGLLR